MKFRSRLKPVANRRRMNVSQPHVSSVGPICCPHCNSDQTAVYCSRNRPVRYHRCRSCGGSFKSVEEPVAGIPL